MVNPPPLNTGVISLLCYYNHGSQITKADFLNAFQSYTEYDNYVDGIVYVWNDSSTGPVQHDDGGKPAEGDLYTGWDAGEGGNDHLAVHIRLRTDGWILAYILRAQEYGEIVWWSTIPGNHNLTEPPDYSTRLAQAILILLTQAGLQAGFNWETSVDYFDYEYPTATKLYMIGAIGDMYQEYAPNPKWIGYWYHTIPAGITLRRAKLAYNSWSARNSYSSWWRVQLFYDTNEIFCTRCYFYPPPPGSQDLGGWNNAWLGTRVADVLGFMTLGIQHYIVWYWTYDNGGNVCWLNGRTCLVIVTD